MAQNESPECVSSDVVFPVIARTAGEKRARITGTQNRSSELRKVFTKIRVRTKERTRTGVKKSRTMMNNNCILLQLFIITTCSLTSMLEIKATLWNSLSKWISNGTNPRDPPLFLSVWRSFCPYRFIPQPFPVFIVGETTKWKRKSPRAGRKAKQKMAM